MPLELISDCLFCFIWEPVNIVPIGSTHWRRTETQFFLKKDKIAHNSTTKDNYGSHLVYGFPDFFLYKYNYGHLSTEKWDCPINTAVLCCFHSVVWKPTYMPKATLLLGWTIWNYQNASSFNLQKRRLHIVSPNTVLLQWLPSLYMA